MTLVSKLKLGALGVIALLSWAYLTSLLLPSCPAQEGGIVIRLLTLAIGNAGAISWTILIIVAAWDLREHRLWFTTAALAAALTTLLVGEPVLLALLSLALVWAYAREGTKVLIEATAVGIVVTESLVLAYLLIRAYTVRLFSPAVFPLHLSLYCVFTPLIPLAAFATLLSPLAAPLRRKSMKGGFGIGRHQALIIGFAMCVLIWAILYASELNRSSELIGVDSITRYYPHALQMLAGGLPSVLQVGYDRPLYYLFLFWLASSLGPFEAVKLLPLVALPLYTLASYFAAREVAGRGVAGLAALIAPLTYTVTAGLYGGLYANWTSLSIALLATASVGRWLRLGKLRWLLAYLLLLAGAVATHVYMGAVFFLSATLSIILSMLFKKYRRRALVTLATQLVLAAVGLWAADHLAQELNFLPPSRVIQSLWRAWWSRLQRVELFSPAWWKDYSFAIYDYAATASLDPTVWFFTFIGVAFGSHGLSSILFVPWLVITNLISLTAPFELIWRAIYDFPFSISEALGLAFLLSLTEEKFGRGTALMCLAATTLFKLNYTLAFAVGLAS